ncbi:MAG: FKBP-type peptidyl-prolyl cis-trans isomerase [Breznakibacter sp.]
MKFSKLFAAALFSGAMMASCSQVPYSGKYTMKTTVDSVSYALGFLEANQLLQVMERMPFDTLDRKDMANLFANAKLQERYLDFRKQQFDTLNEEAFRYGMIHQLRFGKSSFDDMSADVLLRREFDKVNQKKEAEKTSKGSANLEIGKKFLEENKTKEGVVSTESGLQYQIMTAGTGVKPALTDRVKCHYHGTLIDGTVFDSSVERKEPAVFPVNGVIKGWTEALQMMPVGSKWKLFIPSELAYGEAGAGDKILPNSTLVFEVELIEIEK